MFLTRVVLFTSPQGLANNLQEEYSTCWFDSASDDLFNRHWHCVPYRQSPWVVVITWKQRPVQPENDGTCAGLKGAFPDIVSFSKSFPGHLDMCFRSTFDPLDRNTKLVWPRNRFLDAVRFEKYHPLYHGASANDLFLFICIFYITYVINVGVRLI